MDDVAADVQRPTPPLTEEEFIRDALWRGNPTEDAVEGETALDRIIADLRASRAEVERLRESNWYLGQHLRSHAGPGAPDHRSDEQG